MYTVFEDGAKEREALDYFYNCNEHYKYNEILKQAETDPRFAWGNGLNVLLVSDRALGRAEGLYLYMVVNTNFGNVRLCKNIPEIQDYMKSVIPDIIIFVGMADNKQNYQAIEMAKEANEFVLIAMFAFLDFCIESECERYKIPYAFSSQKSVSDGLAYLRSAFEENNEVITQRICNNTVEERDEQAQAKKGIFVVWAERIHRFLAG